MFARSLAGLDRRGLRMVLAAFFLALAVPAAIVIRHAYGQLKWSAFHQQQVLAEEVAARIDARFVELIAREEARSFADYAFLVVAGDPAQNFLQRSPLSAYPVEHTLPGLVGYFQVDAEGAFSTPLLPADAPATSYGVSAEELAQRAALQERIGQILSENRLVERSEIASDARREAKDEDDQPAPEEERTRGERGDAAALGMTGAAPTAPKVLARESANQRAFDELSERIVQREALERAADDAQRRVDDLKLDPPRYAIAPTKQAPLPSARMNEAQLDKRAARKERAAVPQAPAASLPEAAGAVRVRTFESEVDPFALSLLESGHFVLFRNVWRQGQRYIQGVLIDQDAFLEEVAATFRASVLAQSSDLVVAHRGGVLALYRGSAAGTYESSGPELNGALLYQARLSAPLHALDLTFSVHRLPPGPGASLLNWMAVILAAVLCAGFYFMYRLGAGQIALARQQQDFVSAVSHELKTPLTSIRMYGEMLRAGWGSDAQKQTYYDYIYSESERLSRLINNVLQLARMNRNELPLVLKPTTGAELMDAIRSKVSSQIERAGFVLDLRCERDAETAIVQVDADAVLQIVINLVDNAIKFSAKAPEKRIEIVCRRQHDATLLLSVRDYGPGVPKEQTRRIFELFYRAENELTRETVGTGIGLALVHQLARAMRARVDVLNREPGAELRVTFPI